MPSPLVILVLARIGHSDLHFAAHGCTQPHTRVRVKITKVARFCRSQGLTWSFKEWAERVTMRTTILLLKVTQYQFVWPGHGPERRSSERPDAS
jgi:hypothetical protein